jgi:hypothetical protein
MSDLDQFFADRPAEPRTFLDLVAEYGAKMAFAERASDAEGRSTRAADAAEVFAEIGRRYRAAQSLTTYTDRATVMDVLDGGTA